MTADVRLDVIILSAPLFLGFLLDAAVGDPEWLPHPVRWTGRLIGCAEGFIRKHMDHDLVMGGILLAVFVPFVSTVLPLVLLTVLYRFNAAVGVACESVLCCYMLAAGDLRKETMSVYEAIVRHNDIELARQRVARVVGRDTERLDKNGIIRADIETVAENTSDGVTAPLIYMALAGAAGGFFYKSVNTLDSMVGYKNERFREIGMASARLDDVLNFIPSRLTAICMIAACGLVGLDTRGAYRIWRRDRRKHASPNSAQCEAVCAGALGVRLAGDAWYFGELVKKEYIGDALREVEALDIVRANKLMYVTACIMWVICTGLRMLMGWVVLSRLLRCIR